MHLSGDAGESLWLVGTGRIRRPAPPLNTPGNVRGVGDYWDWLAPFLPGPGWGTIGIRAGIRAGEALDAGADPAQPRPTFGSALGTEVGKTIGTLIFWGIAAGVAWYVIRPKVTKYL